METVGRVMSARMCAVVIMFVLASALAQSTTVQTSTAEKNANVTLVVKGAQGGIKGPDGKTHSAFIPCNFTVYVGQTVNLTVINYDNEQHTFTSPELGVNFFIPERISPSAPSVSHFQFTPTKAGIFRWWCAIKCDTAAGEWAMTTGKDGGTGQLGFMAGYVTVLTS